MLSVDWAVQWMQQSASVIAAQRVALNELDAAIGDGDHGENMHRGFQIVAATIGDQEFDDVAAVLRFTARTLMSKVGGAAGPLYGTAFVRAAGAVGNQAGGPGAVADLIEAAGQGVAHRGKAGAGDKTMVDAWLPAAHAAREAVGSDDTWRVLRVAAQAAERGAAATEPLVARRGRASYLGERAIGHRDPGAQSTSLILTAATAVGIDVVGIDAEDSDGAGSASAGSAGAGATTAGSDG